MFVLKKCWLKKSFICVQSQQPVNNLFADQLLHPGLSRSSSLHLHRCCWPLFLFLLCFLQLQAIPDQEQAAVRLQWGNQPTPGHKYRQSHLRRWDRQSVGGPPQHPAVEGQQYFTRLTKTSQSVVRSRCFTHNMVQKCTLWQNQCNGSWLDYWKFLRT